MRYSDTKDVLPPVVCSSSAFTRSRSSGWIWRYQIMGSARHSSGVNPRVCSMRGLM
jgi:hypothetical protein